MIKPGDVNIAIVGIGCKYPGSNSVREFWENILAQRQQFRRLPDDRLNLDYYGSDDPDRKDQTYLTRASVLNGYHFDRVKYRVAKSTFEQTDMAHWLALDVAAEALKDAGFENGDGLDRDRVGVILGNSLNGEFTRANIMRLRWPYVHKVIQNTLTGLSYSEDDVRQVLERAEAAYKAPFPEPDADTLAGGLSNTIAGRICNYFDFHGGGFTVDGACSSSLLSTAIGCNGIMNDELDVVLVGGVDLSIDPFEVIGFSRNGALAKREMEVFSSKSQGFWPGEGCGVMVLMNEALARAKGLDIYGVIRGWGISSDGKGGITRPKPQTQRKAIELAYQKAGYGVDSVALFEGHGTGTPLGDEVELTALITALRGANKTGPRATLGSVKHLIGHTKAAAGVAGMIKACLSVQHNVLPPSRPNSPHRLLRENADVLGLSTEPVAYRGRVPMRAAVSSMGFGGINVHITMESKAPARTGKRRLSPRVSQLAGSARDCEIVVLAASSEAGLRQQAEQWRATLGQVSRAEFTDLAATNNAHFKPCGNWKAAVVARTPEECAEKFGRLLDLIQGPAPASPPPSDGVYLATTDRPSRFGFLFPGQGAPIHRNLGAFRSLSWDLLRCESRDVTYAGPVADTSVAQPVIVERSLQAAELLQHFGVEADLAIGHSLGEITALSWAGALSSQLARDVAEQRGRCMSRGASEPGLLLAIKCSAEEIEAYVSDEGPWITGFNGPGNYVIGGNERMIDRAEERAVASAVPNTRLRVSHAFHTPYMRLAATAFGEYLSQLEWELVGRRVVSTVTGHDLGDQPNDGLTQHLVSQIEEPVRFTQAIETAAEDIDVFFEVGPGRSLTRSLADSAGVTVAALEYGGDSVRGLLDVLATAFVHGAPVAFAELSAGRHYRPLAVADFKLDVLVNPCEKVPSEREILRTHNRTRPPGAEAPSAARPAAPDPDDLSETGVLRSLKELISEKTEIPVEVITDQDRILSELHLNSLAITEIISLATKRFRKDHKTFSAASLLANADASIRDVSQEIYRGQTGQAAAATESSAADLFAEADNWTHAFRRRAVGRRLRKIRVQHRGTDVALFGEPDLVSRFAGLARRDPAGGLGRVAVYLSTGNDDETQTERVLEFAQGALGEDYATVALVEVGGGAPAGPTLAPVFRTLQLEQPNAVVLRISLPAVVDEATLTARLLDELAVATDYREVTYDADGARRESEFGVYFPASGKLGDVLGEEDVVLATGGGKGITFASAHELARLSGAKLILIGRSPAGSNEELDANLTRLTADGIEFEYRAADVLDGNGLATALAEAQRNLGPVTAILHGAGINRPKLLPQLSGEDFRRTAAIKVEGLRNVLASTDGQRLKLLVGYGSIIAQSGMQGNADYAMANEQLARLVNHYEGQWPHCHCLTIEWSVWADTGMGVALGSLDGLRDRGVWPIPVRAGLRQLVDLITDGAPERPARVVVGGRYAGVPTFRFARGRKARGRFLSKLIHTTPGVELVSDVTISRADDLFLDNHVFNGQYVFPTVMIMEGIAQCCRALAGPLAQLTFEDFAIHHSIFVPAEGSTTIRFTVTRTGRNRFRASVRSEDSNFSVACFETTVLGGAAGAVPEETAPPAQPLPAPLPIDAQADFYDDLLFHHGPFRRIAAFYGLSSTGADALTVPEFTGRWFGDFVDQELLLGDAGLNDAAIHCHQVCRPGFNLLPTGVARVVFREFAAAGPLRIQTRELREEGNDTIIDVVVYNGAGEPVQEWRELRLTRVSGTAFSGAWNPLLLATQLEYRLRPALREHGLPFGAGEFLRRLEEVGRTGQPAEVVTAAYTIGLAPADGDHPTDGETIEVAGPAANLWLQVRPTGAPAASTLISSPN